MKRHYSALCNSSTLYYSALSKLKVITSFQAGTKITTLCSWWDCKARLILRERTKNDDRDDDDDDDEVEIENETSFTPSKCECKWKLSEGEKDIFSGKENAQSSHVFHHSKNSLDLLSLSLLLSIPMAYPSFLCRIFFGFRTSRAVQ